ncbi:hypothetical protein [Vibrio sp. THAF190c]|uniref:hypothetical protein n=1 Tax=Vibrio sp. THAF190c TaxID=2587865 RepID=UPI001268D490|nr:hypothetical protein [Vibrio sp. THAF190c]QFT13450.1 hypothetical protein FIV04_26205 [Vibrio sp. THAF190c]
MKNLALTLALTAILTGCGSTHQKASQNSIHVPQVVVAEKDLPGELYVVIPGVHSNSTQHFKSIFDPVTFESNTLSGLTRSDSMRFDQVLKNGRSVGQKQSHSLSNTKYRFKRERCVIEVPARATSYGCEYPRVDLERYQITADTRVYSKPNRTVMKMSDFRENSTSNGDYIASYKQYTTDDIASTFNDYELVYQVHSNKGVDETRTAIKREVKYTDDYKYAIIVNGKQMDIQVQIEPDNEASLITYKVRLPAVQQGNVVYFNKDYDIVINYLSKLHTL